MVRFKNFWKFTGIDGITVRDTLPNTAYKFSVEAERAYFKNACEFVKTSLIPIAILYETCMSEVKLANRLTCIGFSNVDNEYIPGSPSKYSRLNISS